MTTISDFAICWITDAKPSISFIAWIGRNFCKTGCYN